MKKKYLFVLLAAMSLSITACNSDSNKNDNTQNENENDNNTQTDSSDEQKNPFIDTDLNTIDLSSMDFGEMELGEYKNIEVERVIEKVTDEDINNEIDGRVQEYAKVTELDTPSKEGDYVSAIFYSTVNGEEFWDSTDADYEFHIGDKELGTAFDTKITGVKKGDELSFDVTFDSATEDPELIDKTAHFDMEITGVFEKEIPQLNEEFITNSLGYKSYDDMKTSIKAELEEYNLETSNENVKTDLLAKITENCTFTKYSDDLYNYAEVLIRNSYIDYFTMIGYDFSEIELEDIYEDWGLSDESIQEETLTYVYTMMTLQSIAKKENITWNDENYNDYATEIAQEYDYDTAEDYIAEYGDNNIKFWYTNEKVINFLMDNAKIK